MPSALFYDYGYIEGYELPQQVGDPVGVPPELIDKQLGKVESVIQDFLDTSANDVHFFSKYVHMMDLVSGLIYAQTLAMIRYSEGDFTADEIDNNKHLLEDFDSLTIQNYNERLEILEQFESGNNPDIALSELSNQYYQLFIDDDGSEKKGLWDRKVVSNSFGEIFSRRLLDPEMFYSEEQYNQLMKDADIAVNFAWKTLGVLQRKNVGASEAFTQKIFSHLGMAFNELIEKGHQFSLRL